jgi:endonuclease/exonuclease/phosphatase family metal-dependent hydrolase
MDVGHSSAAGRAPLALDLETPDIRIRIVDAHIPLDAGARQAVLTDVLAATSDITDTTLLWGDLNMGATDGTLEGLVCPVPESLRQLTSHRWASSSLVQD